MGDPGSSTLCLHISAKEGKDSNVVFIHCILCEKELFSQDMELLLTLVYWKGKYAVENVDVLLRCCLGVMINLLLQ